MMKNYYLIMFLHLFFLFACKKVSNNDVNNSPGVNVYVVGQEDNRAVGSPSAHTVAKLWKNGTPVNLTDGSHSVYPTSVTVQGNDVFVCGFEFTDAGIAEAMYWKNGLPFKLSPGIINTMAYSIAVGGNDVYVAGFEITAGGEHAMYWKNGNPIYLSYSTNAYSIALSVALTGNDVYIAGGDDVGHAVYWKNGNPVILTEVFTANSISIMDNDIYMAGTRNFGSPYYYRTAAVWKNGELRDLKDSSNDTFGYDVAVSGSDVYVTGHELKGALPYAIYWKNGSLVKLSTIMSQGFSVAVSGNDVYVAGYVKNGGTVATYWKNGNPIYLTDGVNNASANDIFIAMQ